MPEFKQGSPEWAKLRQRALTDLFWFAGTVLGYADIFPFEAETHLMLCKFLERHTGLPDLDEAPMQLVLWPRETGKSSIATIATAIQEACRNPNVAILIANEKQLLAQDFLKSIKHHFQSNDFLRALFPEVIPPDFKDTEWSQTRATLQRTAARPEPTFDTIGVGGAVTGRHFDIILCDDLISKEAVDNARTGSWTVMESANFWLTTLRPLLSVGAKPFPWIRLTGTRWYPRDVYEVAEEKFSHGESWRRYQVKVKLPSGQTIAREARRAGDIAMMSVAAVEQGRYVFPKIWPAERCQHMREENPELFAAFIMNDPSDEAVVTFKQDWISDRRWERLDPNVVYYTKDDGTKHYAELAEMRKILVCDPAFTLGADSDRSAIVILGLDTEYNKYLVLEAVAQKVDSSVLVRDVIDYAGRWDVDTIFIESVAQQLGFIQYVQTEARQRGVTIPIDVVKPGGRGKDLRIAGLASYFQDGKVLFHASQHDLFEEYRKFRPGTKYYRDLLDALAYAVEKLPIRITRAVNQQQRQLFELQLYRQRRGLA